MESVVLKALLEGFVIADFLEQWQIASGTVLCLQLDTIAKTDH